MIYDINKIPQHIRKYFTDAPEIGSEPSPDCSIAGQAMCGKCFVCVMRNVFRCLRRVLRDDGVAFCNLGDTYFGGGSAGPSDKQDSNRGSRHNNDNGSTGLASGNLVGVPWRVALALQADGWVLRQDIIWHKPSPMPESVQNRCTKAHEYVFLLTKGMDYYYDAEAIKEDSVYPAGFMPTGSLRNAAEGRAPRDNKSAAEHHGDSVETLMVDGTRNKRSVWTVTSQGYPGAHFATFPPKLIEPMILAGTSERGCCPQCGNPWKRVLRSTASARVDRPSKTDTSFGPNPSQTHRPNGSEYKKNKTDNPTKTLGWHPTCRCGVGKPPVPCVVLDPFMGSGTTGEVCLKLGRAAVGIELNEEYLQKNAIVRINRAWHTYQHIREVHKGKL